MKTIAYGLLASTLSLTFAHAQLNGRRVEIEKVKQAGIEPDKTYKIVEQIIKDVEKRSLTRRDAYFAIRFDNTINHKEVEAACQSKVSSEGWYFIVTAKILYTGFAGDSGQPLPEVPIVAALRDSDGKEFKPGCKLVVVRNYFTEAILRRSNNPDTETFHVTLETITGQVSEPDVLSRFAAIALSAVGVVAQPVPEAIGGRAGSIENLAKQIDLLRKASGREDRPYEELVIGHQDSPDSTPPRGPGFDLRLKNVVANLNNNGTKRRVSLRLIPTGSIILNNLGQFDRKGAPENSQIEARELVNTPSFIKSRSCLPADSAGCKALAATPVNVTFEQFQPRHLKAAPSVPPKAGEPAYAKEFAEYWDKVAASCRSLSNQEVALGLSTVDAVLIRWAALANAELIQGDKFIEAAKFDKLAREVFAERTDPETRCWTSKHRDLFNAVARRFKVTFLP